MKFVIGFLVLVAVGASSAQTQAKPKPVGVYENTVIKNVTQIQIVKKK